MAAAAGAAVAAATAAQDEDPLLPGPSIGRRAVCSRPYFVVLMVFAHLYVLNVLGLLLFVHISSDDGGEPELGKEAPGPAQDPPALPFSPGSSTPHVLPRLEGIKASKQRVEPTLVSQKESRVALSSPPPPKREWGVVGHKQKVELLPNKIHFMKTLSLKPLLFGYTKIAKTLKLSCSTVAKTIQRFNRTGSTQNRPLHGRPKKLSARAQRHIQRLALGNRRMSAASIAAEVEGVVGQPVSAQTICCTLHQIGLQGCHPRRKPLLKMMHKKARKQFAEDKQTKDMD
ncbi:Transmembrane prolyl 4-hydroxylase [Varanus komodoensis]|nr:Transmembrane prolyl 4-hydroxylase [Varanus komodoensis]